MTITTRLLVEAYSRNAVKTAARDVLNCEIEIDDIFDMYAWNDGGCGHWVTGDQLDGVLSRIVALLKGGTP